uniref:Leucine-rich repeat-containing N-terminal plant-type domain-containing protein n=1 Tax=Fagus sylvatica TaxID=28930 RepID=A0A2N9EMJ7_FAGSY
MMTMGKMNHYLIMLYLASCLFFISHSQTTSNTSSQHHCLPDQSSALLQLKQEFVEKRMYDDYVDYFLYGYDNSIYNGSYPKMKSWKADTDCCSWDGITCDTENGHVVGLNLSNSWLSGTLKSNSSLFNLRHLQKLNLALNDFSSSTIPSQFGQLVKLFWGITQFNRLPQVLESFGSQFNKFVRGGFEQPLTVLPWKNMEYLDLRSNKLQGSLPIPPLSTKYFFASNNNLTGRIPSMICKVNSLQVLDLSNNHLIGQIPQCLGNFSSSLSVLNMRNNSFQGILPETFIKGSSLRTLDLSLNRIEGKIPQSLVKCRQLEVLNLGNNNMNDIFPFWLESLPELQILILRANGFQGPIWDSHTNFGFSKLHVIDLSHNNFTGRLPSEYFKTWNAMLMVHGKINSKPEYMDG